MKALRYAAVQTVPIVFAYLFVGLASGLLLNAAGYAPIWAFLSATFVYAGSMQIVMVTLMTSGVALPVVAMMTLLINARHVFYGLSFIEPFRAIGRQKGRAWQYPYMALTLTDETYSLLVALRVPEGLDKGRVQFYILLLCHLLWIASCTAGAAIGQVLPVDMAGIEFSATALFVAVVVNQWRAAETHIPAILGFASAVLFYFLLGPDNLILPALSVSVMALMLLKPRAPRLAREEVAHE